MTRRPILSPLVLVLAGILALAAAPAVAQPVSGPWSRVIFGSSTGPIITSGTGSPEGVVTAPTGSLFLRTDGAAGFTLWTKVGSGNTGWSTPGGGGGGTTHGLLSPTHLDTTPATPIRGALVVGGASAWGRLTLGAAGTMLRSTGTDAAWSTDGSSLTGLNASSLATGTVADARLSANVSLFGAAVDTAEITPGAITFGTWASNSCTTGQIPKYSGSAWACAPDDAGTGGAHSILSATHLDTVPAALVAGDLLAASGAAALTRLPIGTTGQVLTVTSGTPAWAAPAGAASIVYTTGITVDGAGAAFTTGVKGFQIVARTGTITAATLLSTDAASTACSVVFDVWKTSYATYPPTVANTITASAKPTLASANKSTSTLSGWTTAVTAGDVLGYKVDSVTSCTRATLVLTITP